MSFPLLDLCESIAAKERGMSRAVRTAGNEWVNLAVEDFVKFLRERGESAIEDWRAVMVERGIPLPPSSKVFGCIARTAALRDLIEWTGRYENAKSVLTRAHPVKYWKLKRRDGLAGEYYEIR
jgi:hypothetical protein